MIDDLDGISKIAWELFAATGGVNYYLLHKKTADQKHKKDQRR